MANIKPDFKWYFQFTDAIYVDNRGCDTVADWLSVYGETVTSDQLGSLDYPYKTFANAMIGFNAGTGNYMVLDGTFKENVVYPSRDACNIYGNGNAFIKNDNTFQVNIGNNFKIYYLDFDCGGTTVLPTFATNCVLRNIFCESNKNFYLCKNNVIVGANITEGYYLGLGGITLYNSTNRYRTTIIDSIGSVGVKGGATLLNNELLYVNCRKLDYSTLMTSGTLNKVFFYNCFDDDGVTNVMDVFPTLTSLTTDVYELDHNPISGERFVLPTENALLTGGYNGDPINFWGAGTEFGASGMTSNTNSFINLSFDGEKINVAQWEKQATGGTTTTVKLAADASIIDDYYNGRMIEILSGSAAGSKRTIIDYDGATQTATLSSVLDESADTTSLYCISAFYSKRLDIQALVTATRLEVHSETVHAITVSLSKSNDVIETITVHNGTDLKVYNNQGNYDVAFADQGNMVDVQNVRFFDISFEIDTPNL